MSHCVIVLPALSCSVPALSLQVDDGNNFGVEIQEESINEIAKVEDVEFVRATWTRRVVFCSAAEQRRDTNLLQPSVCMCLSATAAVARQAGQLSWQSHAHHREDQQVSAANRAPRTQGE